MLKHCNCASSKSREKGLITKGHTVTNTHAVKNTHLFYIKWALYFSTLETKFLKSGTKSKIFNATL